jgi:hypothetical protein
LTLAETRQYSLKLIGIGIVAQFLSNKADNHAVFLNMKQNWDNFLSGIKKGLPKKLSP